MASQQQEEKEVEEVGKVTQTPINKVNMEEVFTTVVELRSQIDELSCQTEKVVKANGAMLSTLNQRSNDELELQNNEIKKNADVIRAKLNLMQKNIAVDENGNSSSVIQRILKNQHSYLTQYFSKVMRDHHNGQIIFREKCKAQIQRQLEIVDKVTTDEELEEMLHSNNLAIFVSDISPDAHRTRQALSEIQSRHQNIISLESSIKELHEIFTVTAIMVESQGGLIDNIERNVTRSAEYVDKSKEETQKAVAYKKNRYKIASLPNFLKPLKKQTTAKTATDQNN